MGNNHLTYFKVENFKKFDSLEVNDIGQFNLIVGDNNVGKTCFLEALLIDEDPQQLLDNFWLALKKRGLVFQIEEITKKVGNVSSTETIFPKENYFKEYILKNSLEGLKMHINSQCITINTSENSKVQELRSLSDEILFSDKKNNPEKNPKHFIEISTDAVFNYWVYDYNEYNLKFPLISFNDTPLELESRSIYENLKTKREKQILIDILKVVNSKIVDVELRENFEDLKSVFLISYEDQDEFVPLNFLGDGFKRIFYIALKALSLKGKRILIDEIEIGIHYSKLKGFWVNIFKICKELDIQLFATTHSQECIEAFVEALAIVNIKNEARLISLQEYKKKIYASTYDYSNMEAGIHSNSNLRD